MTTRIAPPARPAGRTLYLSLSFAVVLAALRLLVLLPLLLAANACTPAPDVAGPSQAADAHAAPWCDYNGPPDTAWEDSASSEPGSFDLSVPDTSAPAQDAAPDAQTDGWYPADDGDSSHATDAQGTPACPPVGGLVITEIMVDPSRVADTLGEYVEVLNLSNDVVDLRGWDLVAAAKHHRIDGPFPIVVRPGDRAVLAANADPSVNGGFRADYAWSGLKLGNAHGNLALWCGDVAIDHVAWQAGTWPLAPGRALVLDPAYTDATSNDFPVHWCGAAATFGQGDMGTPGLPESPCQDVACGDGVLQAWEACDDGNTLSGDGCSRGCRVESFSPGAVVLTEFHYAPVAAGSAGEFVELYNPGTKPIDIAGWTLTDERNDRVRILPEGGVLEIPPRGYVVLARSGDPTRNGGILPHWIYGDRFVLGAPQDRIVLSWNGIVIDRVDYQIGSDDWLESKGRSLALDGTCLDDELNDYGAFWCPTPEHLRLPGGDAATPGAPNPPCP